MLSDKVPAPDPMMPILNANPKLLQRSGRSSIAGVGVDVLGRVGDYLGGKQQAERW